MGQAAQALPAAHPAQVQALPGSAHLLRQQQERWQVQARERQA